MDEVQEKTKDDIINEEIEAEHALTDEEKAKLAKYQEMLNSVGTEIKKIKEDYESYNTILEQYKQNILSAAKGYEDFNKEKVLIGLESTAHYGENIISYL